MGSLINSIMGNTRAMSDESIANDMLMGSKAAASAYLNATLESATPELKALFGNNLTQILEGHAAMTNLAMQHNWYKPYEKPEQQLADVFKEAVSAVQDKEK